MDRTRQILKSERFISLQKETVIDFHDLDTPTILLHINFILVHQQVDAADRNGQKPEKIFFRNGSQQALSCHLSYWCRGTELLNLSRSVYRPKNELGQKRRALSCMHADVLRLTDSRFLLQNPSCRTNQITSATSSSSMLLRLLESSLQA